MKITFERMRKIETIYNRLIVLPKFKESKLSYAFKRFTEKNMMNPYKDYNSKMEDFRIDNALEDKETKAILYETDGSYKYDKAGKKQLLKEMREEDSKWQALEFEVTPFLCKEIPPGITLEEHEVETLESLIINPKKDK